MNVPNVNRKKKKYPCPNPLFVKWLTEWKQEAADKGLKTQYTYAKVIFSFEYFCFFESTKLKTLRMT